MTEEQIFNTWLVVATLAFLVLFIGALNNKIVVYRNFQDLGWTICIIIAPIVAIVVLSFIEGDQSDLSTFIENTQVGKAVAFMTGAIIVWAIVRTIYFSLHDNGVPLGLLIAIGKIAMAAIIAILSIGLLNYLFKDRRKLGHIAISLMLSGVFAWFIKILVNGERLKGIIVGRRQN